MLYKLNTEFVETDFNREQITQFENLIMQKIKPDERIPGAIFIWDGISFQIVAVIYNFDMDIKFIHVKQLTTRRKIVTAN
jgi:hypothetical protein